MAKSFLSDTDLLTLKEVADKWRVSQRTVRRQIHEGTARVMPAMLSPYRWRAVEVARDIRTASYTNSRQKAASL